MLLTKSLFALLNNERVLDDTRIDRQIADRLRAQVKKNEEVKEAERAGISEIQSDEFNRILLSFSSTLDDYVSRLETGEEQIKTVGLLIYRYNLLSQNLKKLNFNSLPKLEKDKLVNQLEDLEPKLEELVRYAEINNFTDLKTLKLMLTNFKNKLFQSLPVGDVKFKSIQDLPPDILTKLNFILDFPKVVETDKEFLNKTELKEIEKKVLKATQIKQSFQKGNLTQSKDKDLDKIIDDFNNIFIELEKRKQTEATKKPIGRPKKTAFTPLQEMNPPIDVVENPQLDPFTMLQAPAQAQAQAQAPEPEEEQAPVAKKKRGRPAKKQFKKEVEQEPEQAVNKYDNLKYDTIKESDITTLTNDLKSVPEGGMRLEEFKTTYGINKGQAKEFLKDTYGI
jgi:hypothetical protein